MIDSIEAVYQGDVDRLESDMKDIQEAAFYLAANGGSTKAIRKALTGVEILKRRIERMNDEAQRRRFRAA